MADHSPTREVPFSPKKAELKTWTKFLPQTAATLWTVQKWHEIVHSWTIVFRVRLHLTLEWEANDRWWGKIVMDAEIKKRT